MAWKRVCSIRDIKVDSLKQYAVDEVCILVANLGGEFRAYPPACPHMESPLEESGICKDGILTCTKHLWQWDMRTGAERGPAEKPLLMYDVKLDGDDLLVYVEQELVYEYEQEDDDDFEW